jgi:hypothetical protein
MLVTGRKAPCRFIPCGGNPILFADGDRPPDCHTVIIHHNARAFIFKHKHIFIYATIPRRLALFSESPHLQAIYLHFVA